MLMLHIFVVELFPGKLDVQVGQLWVIVMIEDGPFCVLLCIVQLGLDLLDQLFDLHHSLVTTSPALSRVPAAETSRVRTPGVSQHP